MSPAFIDWLTMLFAVFPVFSTVIFFLAYRGRLRSMIGVAFGFSVVSLIVGGIVGRYVTGVFYAILFSAAGYFPILLRKEVQKSSESFRTRQVILKDKVAHQKSECEKWTETQRSLLKELDQISKRYAFAKMLVSHTEEKPILADFAGVFSNDRKVMGIAFSKLDGNNNGNGNGAAHEDEAEAEDRAWTPAFSYGTISETHWRQILKNSKFPLDVPSQTILTQIGEHEVQAMASPDIELGDFSSYDELFKQRPKSKSLVLVSIPIQWSGKPQGMLTFLLKGMPPPHFSHEIPFYAQLLGLGLYKASLYRMMVDRSRTDGLTNFYLRRLFLERLAEEISFSKRYGTSFSLLMLDLDRFKHVNDTYGHLAGDAVLKQVADCLRSTLHPGVTICRYGGEEFAVLIGLAPVEEVLAIAEKVRAAIDALRIPVTDDVKVKITVSTGVAHYLPDAPSADKLILRADEALYAAKKAGRNQVREWKP